MSEAIRMAEHEAAKTRFAEGKLTAFDKKAKAAGIQTAKLIDALPESANKAFLKKLSTHLTWFIIVAKS